MENVIVFDLGTARLRCMVVEVDPEFKRWRILGMDSLPASGLERGMIVNIDTVKGLVERLQKQTEKRLKDIVIHRICVSVNNEFEVKKNIDAWVHVSGGIVRKSDIENLKNQEAAIIEKDPNYRHHYLISTHPQGFQIDRGETLITTPPIDLSIDEILSSRLTALLIKHSHKENIQRCLPRGIKTDFVANPYALMRSCLSHELLRQGCVLVNMGYGSTSYGVVKSGNLFTAGSIALGGFDITESISGIFGVSLKEAERLKLDYGFATSTAKLDENVISAQNIYGEVIEIQQGDLIDAIGARFDDMIRMVFDEIDMDTLEKERIHSFVMAGQIFAKNGLGFERRAQVYLNRLREEHHELYGQDEIYQSDAQNRVRKHAFRVDKAYPQVAHLRCENWDEYQHILESPEYGILVGLALHACEQSQSRFEKITNEKILQKPFRFLNMFSRNS